MFKKIFKILMVVIFAIGIAWFLLPLRKGGFGLGAIFGLSVCAFGILLVVFYRKISEFGGWRKVIMRIILCTFICGLAWCGYLTILMNSVKSLAPPPNTNIIVLGAQVYSEDHLSLSLSKRVDAAYEYLLQNPEAVCIVTGGQGSNEPCTEAFAQKKTLVSRGIDESRILLEDKSRNTKENMIFSAQIAEEHDLGNEFAVATQSFHMYRSLKLAEKSGLKGYSVIAETDPLLFPAYYGRELLSLTFLKLEELFHG